MKRTPNNLFLFATLFAVLFFSAASEIRASNLLPRRSVSTTKPEWASPTLSPDLRTESEIQDMQQAYACPPGSSYVQHSQFHYEFFPNEILYPTYLAGVNESRMASVWNHDEKLGWIWDVSLGGRAPIFKIDKYEHNRHPVMKNIRTFQIDIEGSVHLRLDIQRERDLDSADFRCGVPLTYGNETVQFKTGYYHVSSHLGDERVLRLQQERGAGAFPYGRTNYYREALLLGVSYRIFPALRTYLEADYAFTFGEQTRPWHFQFGVEYSRLQKDEGLYGSPFAAMNVRLMQEKDYDGNICLQLGWQKRGSRNQLFRIGVQYFGGVREQYEYILARHEHKIGIAMWYDF